MGGCISSTKTKEPEEKAGVRRTKSGNRSLLRTADSLYVADVRKKKDKGKIKAKQLKILHFNDSYNIQPDDKKGEGGAAKFVNALNYY